MKKALLLGLLILGSGLVGVDTVDAQRRC